MKKRSLLTTLIIVMISAFMLACTTTTPQSESESIVESQPTSESIVESQPESETESIVESIVESETESETESESESETESETASETESESESESESEIVTPIDYEDVIGSWVGAETVAGMELAVYEITFLPNQTAVCSYTMQGYPFDLEVTAVATNEDKLLVTANNFGSEKTMEFTIENGNLVSTNGLNGGDNVTLAPKAIALADVCGTWKGIESYSGMDIAYSVEITEVDGEAVVTASYNMFGDYALELVALDNKLVLSYRGVQRATFVLTNGTFVGEGVFGGALTLTVQAPVEDIDFSLLVGTWTGVETAVYGQDVMTSDYVVTFNEDGSAVGEYTSREASITTDLGIQTVTIKGNIVSLFCVSGNYELTYTFTYEDGTLYTESAAMWAELTLTKQVPTATFADIAGLWVGSESSYGMEFVYYITVTAEGTVSGYYTGMGDTDLEISNATFDGETLTLTYPYGELVFVYANDGLTTSASPMGGEVTLTKQA